MNINESALNDAGWVLHDELKKLMGEVPAKVFNNLKPALQVALECYQKKSAEETAIQVLQNDLERAFRLGYRKP